MSSNLNRKILLLIECPACLEHMKAPIFCCVKGHNICSDCCRRLKVCPHCRYPLTTSVRSYVLESIAEILQYPCYNSNAGCTDTLRLNHLEDHHAVCSYRHYRCMLGEPNAQCSWEGRRFKLLEHALHAHNHKVSAGIDHTVYWNETDPEEETLLIDVYGEVFYVHRKLKRAKSIMYWAVQYIGKHEDSVQFMYKFTMSNEEYTKRKIVKVEFCTDDLKPMEDVIKTGMCVAIPMKCIDTFVNNEGQLQCEISIIKD